MNELTARVEGFDRAPAGSARRLVSRRLPWLCTPEQAFVSLFGRDPYAYWLDSAGEPGLRARHSFIGGSSSGSYAIVSCPSEPARAGSPALDGPWLARLRAALEGLRVGRTESEPPFAAGLVGYVAYELKPEPTRRPGWRLPYPHSRFLVAPRSIAFDRLEQAITLTEVVSSGREPEWIDKTARRLRRLSGEPQPQRTRALGSSSSFRSSLPRSGYFEAFDACKQALRAGESYEICLTMQLTAEAEIEPLDLYRILRRVNPAPHAAFVRLGDVSIMSSSPERFISVGGSGVVEARPIKGTAPRSRDPHEDAILASRLRTSEKLRAENLMIADLLRNDLGRVCRTGSVEVPELLAVESFANVHQLVSTVAGRLREGMDALDAMAAAFPPGSMTGAPKLRTMEIIDRLEPCARGVYSGCLGYFDVGGGADLSVVIRTLVQHGRTLSCGTGGAVTADSDVEDEYEEAMLKARPLLEAVAVATGAEAAVLATE